MVSPIQMMQAFSIIANDGVMVKPYVVNKIVSSEGKTVLENKRTEIGRVASKTSTDKMKELLRSVINPDYTKATGYAYFMDGYDLIGKTGTASIYENGGYLSGGGNYIYSFAGLYPGDDPEVIMYIAIKKPKDTVNYMAPAIKEVLVNVDKSLDIKSSNDRDNGYEIVDYTNNITTEVVKELTDNNLRVITLGTGKKIINQYPDKDTKVYKNNLVILLTSDYDKSMIDFNGLSYKEAKSVLDLMGVSYNLSGYGYVVSQNIEVGAKIDKNVELELKGL